MKIAVIDDYQDLFRQCSCYARLAGHEVIVFHDTEKDPLKLATRLQDAEVVVLTQQRSAFPRTVIERLPKLRLIAQTGRNTQHVDVAACSERGILVSAAGAGASPATAEFTWGLILSAVRHLPYEVEQLKRGAWQSTVGTGLYGKTLGIYSYGRIGSSVAAIGKAFGMNILCWGREGSQSRARAAGYEVAAGRAEFFERADILSLHLALNDETRGIVSGSDLARMKPSALFVNNSRAPLIEAGALAEALQRGRPGYAAVDVYEDEPVTGASDPLLKLPNALCTPHLGYVERTMLENLYAMAVDGILGYASGAPVNLLNPEARAKD